MSYQHHHISHEPLPSSGIVGHLHQYPPPRIPPSSQSLGYTHTHHSPSPPPPFGYQGYHYDDGAPSSAPLPPPSLPPRNDYHHGGCSSFLMGW
ncbi:hypothetical protein DITRI_Ditri01bG0130400 [Diplodiscus trichospermus]